ncbi:hypothetical protein SAMN06272775_2510 [Streptomyces sp. 2323.1]|nr:hypothetical protein SAMN06272775_2510 [Streptomyces sp. 2323.1]
MPNRLAHETSPYLLQHAEEYRQELMHPSCAAERGLVFPVCRNPFAGPTFFSRRRDRLSGRFLRGASVGRPKP